MAGEGAVRWLAGAVRCEAVEACLAVGPEVGWFLDAALEHAVSDVAAHSAEAALGRGHLCAVLAWEDTGRISDHDAGPPCVVLALEDAGPPRTYRVPLSSRICCVGVLGWQLLALLARTTSSVEELRATTALLRASSGVLPPFAIIGFIFLVLGAITGFQLLPLLRKLQVACLEIALFTLGPRLI